MSFGRVPVGATASQSVTLTNRGAANLSITQVSTTAADVTVPGISLPLAIPAGKQANLDIVYSPKTAGALSGQVSVMSSASNSPSTVSLSGTGMAATSLLAANVSNLNFGSVPLGKSGSLSVSLTNAGNSSVTVSQVSASGAPYSVSGVSAGLILSPGQSASLDVTFSPLSAGSAPGSVVVTSNATNSPMTISLLANGTTPVTQPVSHSVTLSWSPSASAVAGYLVYRSEISGGPYSRLDPNPVAADTYVDPTVQGGLIYYYVVTAVTSGGVESPNSAQVSATIPTP